MLGGGVRAWVLAVSRRRLASQWLPNAFDTVMLSALEYNLLEKTTHTPMENSKATMSKKAPNYVIGLVPYISTLLPFGIAVFYVHLFGVNVFFADDWDFVVLAEKLYSGTLSIADLFVHEDEHIMFFPKIVVLSLGTVTRYDTVPLMYLVQICLLVTSITLFLAFRRSLRHQPLLSILLFTPIPFLVFSFRQHENMLWANQITFAFAQTFAVLALYLLHVLEDKDSGKLAALLSTFLVALVSATIASFSAVPGMLVWPAGILPLFVAPIKRSVKNLLLGSWGLIGLGEWIFYVTGGRPLIESRNIPSLFFVLEHPLIGVYYFVTLLGSSLFWQDTLAFSGGLLLVCLLITVLLLVYESGRLKENSFWVALLLFSLLSLMAITVARSMLANEQVPYTQAIDSRYAIFSTLAVVSVYAMFVTLAWGERSQVVTALLGSVLGLVLLSISTSYLLGITVGEATKTYREELAEILLDYKSEPDEALAKFGDNPKRIREYAPFLERRNYNVFADQNTVESEDAESP
jgi:hypothetical protein